MLRYLTLRAASAPLSSSSGEESDISLAGHDTSR